MERRLAVADSLIADAMIAAITAATEPTIRTADNPRVGCALLTEFGQIIAVGAHRGPGTLHAEADALAQVAANGQEDLLDGGIAVVTLEPCNHTGRTPPCSRALAAAGIKTLYYGVKDPNSIASGGSDYLRGRGVEVHAGYMADAARAVDHRWLSAVRLGRPHVTWKYAATLDGHTAAVDGTSKWITSVPARQEVHDLRAAHDAVLVGTGTALTDNPQLTVRDASGYPVPRRLQPTRIVMGERPVPSTARVRDDSAPTLFITERDPYAVLKTLWDDGFRRVFLEGGAQLAASFLAADCVDEIRAFIAPLLLGRGTNVTADLGITTISKAHRWALDDVQVFGPDVCLTLLPEEA